MIKVVSIIVGLAAWSSAFSLSHAQSAGNVEATSGAPGGVLVTRDGESYSILAGDPVFSGDVVTTTSTATASITAFGCTIDLLANRSVAVDADFCTPGAVTTVSNDNPGADGTETGGTAVLLGGAGLAALVGLAAGGGGGGGGGGGPVSP